MVIGEFGRFGARGEDGRQETECRRQETEKRRRIPDGFPACRDSGQASLGVEQRSIFWGFGRLKVMMIEASLCNLLFVIDSRWIGIFDIYYCLLSVH